MRSVALIFFVLRSFSARTVGMCPFAGYTVARPSLALHTVAILISALLATGVHAYFFYSSLLACFFYSDLHAFTLYSFPLPLLCFFPYCRI